MRDCSIDPIPTNGDTDPQSAGARQARLEWVRENFTQIFGTSAEELQGRGVNPRQYARDHRDEIRRFAQQQRRQGIAVPSGRAPGTGGPGGGGGGGGGFGAPWSTNRGYGYGGGGRFGIGMRGGTAWIGILVALLALRFLLVGTFVGAHAAILWVLVIGGIMLVARVVLFSWLRKRRYNRRQSGQNPGGRSGF